MIHSGAQEMESSVDDEGDGHEANNKKINVYRR